MNRHFRVMLWTVAFLALSECAPADEPLAETLVLPGGATVSGRLERDGDRGFVFREAGKDRLIPIDLGMSIRFPGRTDVQGAGLPPFRVDLGLKQSLSGRLGRLTDREIELLGVVGPESIVRIDRAGAAALLQRPGEVQVLEDPFETIETSRWRTEGDPKLVAEPHQTGKLALALPARGAALVHNPSEPFTSARCDLAFHDTGKVEQGRKAVVELTFRGTGGPEYLRVVLGWAEESLGVESPNGPALAVQRLGRTPGWHRLAILFNPERIEISVDGNELAHGKGITGPLTAIRLATDPARSTQETDLAAHIDDLRLVRYEEPSTDVEIDPSQDEARLTGGDQLFGWVESGGPDQVRFRVNTTTVPLRWGEIAGLYFKRVAKPGVVISGRLVEAEWRNAPGRDPRDLDRVEGALLDVSENSITLATAYAGKLTVPRSQLTRLGFRNEATRLVIDPTAHHLGDEVSVTPPFIDPPQPDGSVLERAFELPDAPGETVELVLDVVHVVGEGNDLPFAQSIAKGELRTNVSINGSPFDYLNRHIHDRNETPARIRLNVPRDALRRGRNVIRFEQVGIANDPNYLDDLGILGIAVEVSERPANARGR